MGQDDGPISGGTTMPTLAHHSSLVIKCKTKGREYYTYPEHNSSNFQQNLDTARVQAILKKA